MNHSTKFYSALIGIFAAAANPSFAQTWDPTGSDAMNNAAMGANALANPDMDSEGGCHNTGSGTDALAVDTSGSYNVGTGFSSLTHNTTGNYNTAVGGQSLNANTVASTNTATGFQSLYSESSTYNDTAVGYQALY